MKKLLLLLTFILSQGLMASPLRHAVYRGDVAEVVRLLDLGADVNATGGICNRTPLHEAAMRGHIDLVKLLLDKDADINARDAFNTTPLHGAVSRGHIRTARLLLDRGAYVNVTDVFNRTPLHEAISGSLSIDIIGLLLDRGADINVVSNDMISSKYSSNDGSAKISRPIVSILEGTPLHEAAYKGHMDTVELLINHPLCDHTIADKDGKTPEKIAGFQGHQKIAIMLHNAPSVNKKIFNSGKGLQLFAARVANRKGVYEEDYNESPYAVRKLITNIIKDKKLRKQQNYCSIQ